LRFVDQQPRETIPAYISASDACLVMLKKTDLFKTVIPTKLLEFMACERPVIVGVDGEARKIIESAQAGVYVTPESVNEFADAIVRLKNDAKLRETLARNGRRHIQEHFSRRKTADQYLRLLEELLQVHSSVKQAA
jgi:glycosyltransferase involved in cell wall biosynthesis